MIGHHKDKGGRFAICEPLDWMGAAPPGIADVATSEVRPAVSPHRAPQFLFDERSRDRSRLVRGGIASTPKQRPGAYTAFVAPYVDRLLAEMFGLE